MKPIPRTQYKLEYQETGNFPKFLEEYKRTGYYPVYAFSEFLLYDNRLREFGFTDYAIQESKRILGIDSFGVESMLVFMDTSAKNTPGIMTYDRFYCYCGLMLTKIDNRANDPYA
ncbi:MAG: hypothetical protein ACRCXZ_07595, partial [Patescibacteria group bacterium]